MTKRYAVIEIGTKGIRLLVCDASELGIEKVVYSTGELSYLGKEQDVRGNLSKSSINRVNRISNKYYDIAKSRGAEKVIAIATEVVRSARNRLELENTISKILPFNIITQEEEATYSFIAAANAFKNKLDRDVNILVIDQGGGSTELAMGNITKGGHIALEGFASLKLGTSSLSKILVSKPNLKQGFVEIQKVVVDNFKRSLADSHGLSTRIPDFTVGMGSSIMNFAKILIHENTRRKLKLHQLHEYTIETRTIAEHIEKITPALDNFTNRGSKMNPEDELATFISGIVVYHEIAKHYNVRNITLNRQGMRYGVIISLVGKAEELNTNKGIDNITSQTTGKRDGLVAINTATVGELMTLPKIGVGLAEKIVEYRIEKKGFSDVDELVKIPGIGSNTIKIIRHLVTV